jgi:hypothetical protein
MSKFLRGKLWIFFGLSILVLLAQVGRMMHSLRSAISIFETSAGSPEDPSTTMDAWRMATSTVTVEPQSNQKGNRTAVNKVTILQHFDPSKCTANATYKNDVREIILGEEHPTTINVYKTGNIHSVGTIRKQGRKKNVALSQIDRIYYINMDNRPLRRAIMEAWLSEQSIPYERVAAHKGQPEDTCVEGKTGRRCIGISGLARTYLHIIDNLNTTGLTLVLEDDFVIRRRHTLLPSVNLVPQDWDILRWDCWQDPLPYFEHYPFSFKINPIDGHPCKTKGIDSCSFCGGTHAALWRGGESLQKLRRLWGVVPRDDVDCLLHHHNLSHTINTYCIQVGIGEYHNPLAESSDISKVVEQSS